MSRHIAAAVLSLASLTPLFIFQYEAITNLGAELETNRAAVESRVRLSQTNSDTGAVNEAAVKANITALDRYKATLDAAKNLQ